MRSPIFMRLSSRTGAPVSGVSARTLRRWRQRQQQGASLEPGHAPGRALTIGSDQWDAVRTQVAAAPDATLAEHCDRWAAEQGVRVSPATFRIE